MLRATMAAALLVCLTLTAGCSSSDPKIVLPANPPTKAAGTTADAAPTQSASPLEGMSASQVWSKTKADAAEAETVHVAGRFLDGKVRVRINLSMAVSGKVLGVMAFNGDKLTVRRLGKVLYFKADRGFWIENADARTAEMLTDRWIKVRRGFSADMEDLFEFTDMEQMVTESLDLSSSERRSLKLVPGISIGDLETIGLTTRKTDASDDFDTLYISATDPALPMNFALDQDDSQYIKFRDWNEPFDVVAPKESIDLAALG